MARGLGAEKRKLDVINEEDEDDDKEDEDSMMNK